MKTGDVVLYKLLTPDGIRAYPAIILDQREAELPGRPNDLELVAFTAPGGAVYRGWVQHAPTEARLAHTWCER
jgi:hypothetical protein